MHAIIVAIKLITLIPLIFWMAFSLFGAVFLSAGFLLSLDSLDGLSFEKLTQGPLLVGLCLLPVYSILSLLMIILLPEGELKKSLKLRKIITFGLVLGCCIGFYLMYLSHDSIVARPVLWVFVLILPLVYAGSGLIKLYQIQQS
jgi:hypothetical protein